MEKRSLIVLLSVVVAVVVIAAATSLWLQEGGGRSALPPDTVRLPPGFRIDVYAANVPVRYLRILPVLSSGVAWSGNPLYFPKRDM